MRRLAQASKSLLLLAYVYLLIALLYGVLELLLTLAGYVGPRAKLACILAASGGGLLAAALAWRRGLERWVRSERAG
jgi:hypothetical protein